MTPEPGPTTVFITLGSNVEPRTHLRRALGRLEEVVSVEAVSAVYESEPFGAPGTARFLNAAVRARTSLEPAPLKSLLQRIEAELGRRRTADRNAPRTIDLDIALYGRRQVDDRHAGLRIPDPEIGERPYLALPLADVGAEVRHPESGEPLARIADRLAAGADRPRRIALKLALKGADRTAAGFDRDRRRS